MELLQQAVETLWPSAGTIAIALLLVWAIHRYANREGGPANLLYQLLIWVVSSTAVIVVVILLPFSEQTQGQVLSLLGVVLTAVIALSSTTFVSNAMAGVMLQATQPFRPGDYIRVNDQFGRVARLSLIHTQIQTEWRDLTTLPNMLLVTNPITVLHREGTIIHAEVSIGYDVAYTRIEELLHQAAVEAGLEQPFVLVHALLDHAVVYRACGFLPEMKNLLSARSNLHKRVLEQLHGNGVEIVSPAFMNQRQLDPGRAVIPEQPVIREPAGSVSDRDAPEAKIFDMAEEAASLEELKQHQEDLRRDLKRERAHLKVATELERDALVTRIADLERRERWYAELVEQRSGQD